MSEPKTYEKRASNRSGVKRLVFAGLSVLLEAALLISLFTWMNEYAEWINIATRVTGLLLVLALYSQHRTSALKMPWIMLILTLPVFGVALYLLIGLNGAPHRMRRRYEAIDAELLPMLPENDAELQALAAEHQGAAGIASYLKRNAGYPVYRNTDVTFYPEAAAALEAQLEAIASAQSFIFLEYHAIENRQAWGRLQAALEERALAGVEVRVFYDDIGSIFFVNTDFARSLEAVGIRCRAFNPLVPVLNLFLNNRDHRKITVVDGRIGFTGGYNLADEYFNLTHPYGDWKDTGIRLEGEAVRSLTMTFLEMWNAVSDKDEDDADFARYLPPLPSQEPELDASAPERAGQDDGCPAEKPENSNAPIGERVVRPVTAGFVQPYADSPMDNEQVGEEVYISMANQATEYCWFMTPYLIISDELNHALCLAAKRGVDVRIITPGIPDKRMVYSLTRSFYSGLVAHGVRIFEWTPGFCHAKMSVADDVMATCGTINLDYRSLYHHFENGCFLCGGDAVKAIWADFEHTFSECREMTEQYRERSRFLRLGQLVLRLFAGLM